MAASVKEREEEDAGERRLESQGDQKLALMKSRPLMVTIFGKGYSRFGSKPEFDKDGRSSEEENAAKFRQSIEKENDPLMGPLRKPQ